MPSDPSGMKPSGVLMRPAPDFFDDNMGLGAWFFFGLAASPDSYFAVALFNNDNQGRALKVYGVSVYNDGGSGQFGYYVYGTIGARQYGCQAIRPDLGAPPGEIWVEYTLGNVSATPSPYNFGNPASFYGSSGYDSQTYLSTFPLAIVPAGYSYVLTNLQSCETYASSFWYQVANE